MVNPNISADGKYKVDDWVVVKLMDTPPCVMRIKSFRIGGGNVKFYNTLPNRNWDTCDLNWIQRKATDKEILIEQLS